MGFIIGGVVVAIIGGVLWIIMGKKAGKLGVLVDTETSTSKEINENLPSRSAKLRYVKKRTDFYDFETDILDQFKNLIEIENLGNKL